MKNNHYLAHYGVKGMKWGVRRTPEELGYKTYSAQKGDVTLKKGQTFQRITTNANSGFTRAVYTSYRNKDKDLYKGTLGRMRLQAQWKNKDRTDPIVLKENTMTAKKDLHLPSRKVRIDHFKKLREEDPEGVAAMISEFNRLRNRKDKKPKNDDEAYQIFNDALSMRNEASSKGRHVIDKYFLSLKKEGYDAIADENDIRLSTYKAQAPIILFNSKESIGNISVRDLSASEVYAAYTRSFTKKTIRNLLEPKGVGFEKLEPNTEKQAKKYADQLMKDKDVLSKNYTIENLAEDWVKGMSKAQIKKISDRMDQGMSHEEALASNIGLGNLAVAKLMDMMNL